MLLISNSQEQLELLDTINRLREELIVIGIREGLTSQKTIALSQELDEYIAKFQVKLSER